MHPHPEPARGTTLARGSLVIAAQLLVVAAGIAWLDLAPLPIVARFLIPGATLALAVAVLVARARGGAESITRALITANLIATSLIAVYALTHWGWLTFEVMLLLGTQIFAAVASFTLLVRPDAPSDGQRNFIVLMALVVVARLLMGLPLSFGIAALAEAGMTTGAVTAFFAPWGAFVVSAVLFVIGFVSCYKGYLAAHRTVLTLSAITIAIDVTLLFVMVEYHATDSVSGLDFISYGLIAGHFAFLAIAIFTVVLVLRGYARTIPRRTP